MLNVLFALGLAATLAGCGRSGFKVQDLSNRDSASEGVVDGPDTRSPRACFGGTLGLNQCWSTVPLSDVDANQKLLYVYPDPLKDPSFPRGFDPRQYRTPARLLRAHAIDPLAWLSPNFQRGELIRSDDRRGHFGLFSRLALGQIQALRDELNATVSINSGYRSPGFNGQLAGSARWSRHTYGDAIDFSSGNRPFDELASLCRKHGAAFFQIYRTHIHCDWRSLPHDGAFFDHQDLEAPLAGVVPAAEVFTNTVATLESLGSIEVTVGAGEVAPASGSRTLKAHLPLEDDATPRYSWTVVTPSGLTYSGFEAEFTLETVERGVYHVEVEIGGSVVLRRSVTFQ